jgi:uncharacterized protein (UPF0333 family)
MKNKDRKKVNKQNIKNKTSLIVLIVILLAVFAGAFIYLLGDKHNTSEQSSPSGQHVISEAEAKQEANTIISKVEMNMTKDEVIAIVGQPHSCSSRSGQENGTTYTMEHCSFGKENTTGYAVITFLNGKVWGSAYEAGAIHTK